MRKIWVITALLSLFIVPSLALNSTCDNLHLIPSVDQCAYVISNCQDHKLGYLDYFKLYYCQTSPAFKFMAISFTLLLLCIMFISLGLTSSEFLCPNLSTISFYLSIPDNLSGLTLLAFGNGSPDILGTYTSFMSDNGSLAVGELVGSAFLITSLVIGLMCVINPFKIYNDETHTQDKLIFIRDVSFFIISVLLVIFFLSDGKLQLWECLVMIALYLAYVAIIICWNWILKISKDQVELDLRVRNMYNYDEEIVIHDVEDTDTDKLENFTTLMRPSIFDALEFQSVLADLQKKQSLAINGLSGLSDQDQMDLIRQSLNNRPATVAATDATWEEYDETRQTQSAPLEYNDATAEYELRNSNIEDEIDNSSGFRNLLLKRYHLNLQKNELIQLFPLIDDFKSNSMLQKIFLTISLPVYLLLKITIPVRQLDDFNKETVKFELNLLLIQTTFSPLLIGLSTIGSSSSTSLWITLAFSILFAVLFPFLTFTILQKSHSTNLKNVVHLSLSFIGFFTSISWISIIAAELVSILKFIANLLNLSDLILGLTLFAMGNSIGDFISNFTIAKMGFPLMALLACFGGPLLNLLLGIGLNGIIVLISKDLTHFNIEIDTNLIISSVFLFFNLIFMVVVIPYNNWKFDRWVGLTMILLWCVGTLINVVIATV